MTLRLVEPDAKRLSPQEASREAWSHVLDGFRAALLVEGLPAHEHHRIERCIGHVTREITKNGAA